MTQVIALTTHIGEEDTPWSMMGSSSPDLMFIVNGENVPGYHQAILAMHSSLIRDLTTYNSLCPCRPDLIISLDNVSIDIFNIVMNIVYDGCGKVPDDVIEFRYIVNMLGLDSLFIRDKENKTQESPIEKPVEVDNITGSNPMFFEEYDAEIFNTQEEDIEELKLSNLFSDALGTFEDDNFSVSADALTVNELNTTIDIKTDMDSITNLEDNTTIDIKTDMDSIKNVEDNTTINIKTDMDSITNLEDLDKTEIKYDTKLRLVDETAEDIDENNIISLSSDDESASSNESESSDDESVYQNIDDQKEMTSGIIGMKNGVEEDYYIETENPNIIKGTNEGSKIESYEMDEEVIELDNDNVMFDIRNVILNDDTSSSNTKNTTYLSSNTDNKSSMKILENLQYNNVQVSISVNKKKGVTDLEKILEEDDGEHFQDTLAESSDKRDELKDSINNVIKKDIKQDNSKDIVTLSTLGRRPVTNPLYQCPFSGCSHSNRRSVDFFTHLGAVHYKTRVKEQFTDFFNKTCAQCNDKVFSVTSNYYAHMAKHLDLPYMNKEGLQSLIIKENTSEASSDNSIETLTANMTTSNLDNTNTLIVANNLSTPASKPVNINNPKIHTPDTFIKNDLDKPEKRKLFEAFLSRISNDYDEEEDEDDDIIELSPPKRSFFDRRI